MYLISQILDRAVNSQQLIDEWKKQEEEIKGFRKNIEFIDYLYYFNSNLTLFYSSYVRCDSITWKR